VDLRRVGDDIARGRALPVGAQADVDARGGGVQDVGEALADRRVDRIGALSAEDDVDRIGGVEWHDVGELNRDALARRQDQAAGGIGGLDRDAGS